jgi:hypothetical protein
MDDKIINSVSEFIEEIKKIGNVLLNHDSTYNLWFRAENEKYSTLLIPSFYRETDFINLEKDKSFVDYSYRNLLNLKELEYLRAIEGNLRAKFYMNNSIYQKSNYKSNSWEIYYSMQHYGIATRLLDWTENALIALFFCIENKNDYNGIVWVLNPFLLNDSTLSIIDKNKSSIKYDKVYIPERSKKLNFINKNKKLKVKSLLSCYLDMKFKTEDEFNPVALSPVRFDLRMKNQKSNFTIFGNNTTGIMSHPDRERFLRKIIINKKNFESIKEDLLILGITHESIYPGLEGVSKDAMYETRNALIKSKSN